MVFSRQRATTKTLWRSYTDTIAYSPQPYNSHEKEKQGIAAVNKIAWLTEHKDKKCTRSANLIHNFVTLKHKHFILISKFINLKYKY